jgi:small-conductance mechanosensitive channel
MNILNTVRTLYLAYLDTMWTLPVLCIVGGALLGMIVDVLLRTSLRATAARTNWAGDDIIISVLRGKPTLWCMIGGVFAAMRLLPFDDDARAVLGKALVLVLVLSITLVSARIATGLIQHSTATAQGVSASAPSTSILVNLTRLLIIMVGMLVMLQALQIPITPILTTLGVGGLAVALALQDTLTNLFAGIYILLSKKIRVGDYVKLQTGEEGYVTDINLRHTTVRELANNMIVIPNSRISSSINRNYYLPNKETSVLIEVLVGYDSDLARVERVATEVGRETLRNVQGGIADFEPVVRFNTFSDLGIKFNTVLRAKEVTDQHVLRHEFIKRLHQRFHEEHIDMPSLNRAGFAGERLFTRQ